MAFAAFYDRYESLWFTLALRIVQVQAEAEDVLQEAAVTVWERAAQYHPEAGRPASWSVALVRNKAIDRVRSMRRRSGLHERAAGEAGAGSGPGPTGPLADPFAMDAGPLVRRGLAGLSPEQRQVIELAYFEGSSQAEIAERLGVPLGTIKARMRRGMLAMRDALEGAL